MARLFDDGSEEYLTNANGIVTAVPLSIACWFNSNDDTISQELVSVQDTALTDNFWRLSIRGSAVGNPIAATTKQNGGTAARANTNTGYSANTWHHACGVFPTNNSRSAFIDGGSKVTNSDTQTPSGIDTVGIGALLHNPPNIGAPFSGHIAEVAVWNAALTDAEDIILAKGYSPLFVQPQNLVSYWTLIRGLNDKVGGYNMTASGTVVSAHPRIIYPSKIWVPHIAAVSGTILPQITSAYMRI